MGKKLSKHLKGPFVNAIYDKRNATIYLKNPDGQYTTTTAYPSFFIRDKHKNRFPINEYKKHILETIEEGRYIRYIYDPQLHYKKRREMIEVCADEGCPLYEADVHPIVRWFSDTGSSVEKKFKSLYFDIETHPIKIGFDDDAKKQHRVISFAAYDEDGNSWFVAANENTDTEEVKVIEALLRIAKTYDVLLAWNGDNYDFFVLRARCKLHKIKVDWRDWNLLDHMKVVKKALMSISDSQFKRSFRLDAIGENVLGIRKIKLPVPPGEMYRLLGRRVAELEEYNRRDVEIMLQIEQRKEFLKLHYAICSICKTFPNRQSLFPNALADGILLRLGIQENIHFPSRTTWDQDDDEQQRKYEGAFVFDPIIGFHENIQVPDFASLYPSIIVSFNMSRETLIREGRRYPPEVEADNAHCTATNIRFRTDFEGILPKVVKQLMQKRSEYKERSKHYDVGTEEWKNMNNLSTAVKVVTNSFYGLLGNEGSRYYELDIARSITLTGQLLIREMANYFERKGYKSIYGDTDSIFIRCSVDEVRNELDEINNQFIPNLLNRFGCRECAIHLDFDKGFKTLLIVTKKRYAGKLALHKGRLAPDNMEPEIKGIEVQRSDQFMYGQQLLKKYIPLLLESDTNPALIDQMVRLDGQKFYNKELTKEELQITKSISRPLDEYTAKQTHIRVAEQMVDEGLEVFVGMKIPYIVVKSKPNVIGIHADKYDGKCDKDYYWQRAILPPIQRLLDARFQKYHFNNFTNLNQRLLDFSGTETNDSKYKRRKVRMPKLRRIRKPVERKVRVPITTITIPSNINVGPIKGISKIIKTHCGKIKIRIAIKLDDPECIVDINPMETVSMEGLKKIKKLFPGVLINPNPL